MAKKTKLKWNRNALRQIRYGDADNRVISDGQSRVQEIAERATAMAKANGFPGAKYETSSQPGKRKPQGRHRNTVITANAEAMLDNAKNNTLLKATFGAG